MGKTRLRHEPQPKLTLWKGETGCWCVARRYYNGTITLPCGHGKTPQAAQKDYLSKLNQMDDLK